MKSLNKSVRYRSFIQGRNKALEEILQSNLRRLDQITHGLLLTFKEIVSFQSARLFGTNAPFIKDTVNKIDQRLEQAFGYASQLIHQIFIRTRIATYTLSYAGEVEGIGRALGRAAKANLTKDKATLVQHRNAPGGGQVNERIDFILLSLKRKVLDAIHRGLVLGEDVEALYARIDKAFPTPKKVAVKPIKKIKGPKLREAKKRKWKMEDTFDIPTGSRKIGATTGFIDDELWDTMVREYLADEIPLQALRTPEHVILVDEYGKDVPRYAWELEQEATQDFVELVREGQIDAAKDNGVKDFMWISVLDDRTDECCTWRDGLSSSEIERQLKTKHKNDNCPGITTPPAHFNCRCDLAPIDEALPDKPPSNLGDFESWLKT